ncbi:MAG: iron-sulfur cluster assembly accessory protein [Deltaproteobacteria bacterium]|nr:iron-sulfur cluster assembly accessory protein [Deltaproteobacteria bacterium]
MSATETINLGSPTPAPAGDPSYPISLTTKAVGAVKLAIEEEGLADPTGLRVAVVGGGCSGYSYALDFSDEFDEEDLSMDFAGLTVVMDPHSAQLLSGTEIDYVETLQKKGFVFNNPNATRTCGCGSSFS